MNDDELIEKMWIAFNHAPNPQMRAVLAVVRAHDSAELTAMTAERDRLREALADACERMERARGILRKPGESEWAMLDTAALRAALGD